MSNEPAENPSGDDDNPFKGTPFEQFFAAFGGSQSGSHGSGMDLSQLMQQMQKMMSPHEGSVNWDLAKEVARQTVAQASDPTPSGPDQRSVADAVTLADHWLDNVTDLPSGVSTTAVWSRAEWVEETMPVWRRLVEPVAEHVVAAMSKALPEEARQMAGPLIGMLNQAGGAMFGQQVGQGIGGLANEVLTASDISLPLGPAGKAALLPHNVAEFADGLGVSQDDVILYLALREAAHQRLFAHVPWLRSHLLSAVEDYGRGTTIDVSKIESSLRDLDPSNLGSLQEALEGGLFEPEQTPAQQAALSRLETALALVEGWVDEVVGQATAETMPAAAKLQEAVRRRRAAGGPAEQTFAALVGLELRPRRLRDASTLWGALRSRDGHQARDAVWAHPDLLPSADDLEDPLAFRPGAAEQTETMSGQEFDDALAELLDSEHRRTAGTGSSPAAEAGSATDESSDDGSPTDPANERDDAGAGRAQDHAADDSERREEGPGGDDGDGDAGRDDDRD